MHYFYLILYYLTIEENKIMKKFYVFIFLLLTLFYTSCAAVETIFKVGMVWGIFLVVGAILLVIYIFSRIRKKE